MERPKNNDKRGRTWLCTLNNPELTLEQVHQSTSAAYTVGQLEQGSNGTLHLQFVQNFKNPVRLAHYKKAFTTGSLRTSTGRQWCRQVLYEAGD